jgi:hypothetical protein
MVRCEDWYSTIIATGNYLGGERSLDLTREPDPCPRMEDDVVYGFYVLQENYPETVALAAVDSIPSWEILPKAGDFIVTRYKLVWEYW